MVERSSLVAHAIVAQGPQESRKRSLICCRKIDSADPGPKITARREVSVPCIELQHLFERGLTAVVEVRTGKFDIAKTGSFKRAGGTRRRRSEERQPESVEATEANILRERRHAGAEKANVIGVVIVRCDIGRVGKGGSCELRALMALRALGIVSLEHLQTLPLQSRQSLRIAFQELIDTRPHASAWHHHILNDRTLYGLPRKFNVSFDGGGVIPTLEDTNDIGFQAVRVLEGADVAAGVWYRLALGGITGHRDLARDTGVIVAPDEGVAVADAIVRVFIAHGDRTNRNKARLKYLLDAWGFERFLVAVEETLGRKLARVDASHVAPRAAHDRLAHVGVHAQRQQGLNWIGVWTPLGKITCAQMHDIAEVARVFGDGDIRLTVWQNLLVSGIPDAQVEAACSAIHAAGLSTSVSNLRAGLVACTGSTGCKFAASDTTHAS